MTRVQRVAAHMVVGQILEVVLVPDVAPGILVLRHEHRQGDLQWRPCVDAKPLCQCRPHLDTGKL